MNIICTGISKCEKLSYFRDVSAFSKELHKQGKGTGTEITIYSEGDLMKKELQEFGTVNEHLLGKDNELRAHTARSAIKTTKIKLLEEKIKKEQEKHNIISTHTCFIWKSGWKEAYNEEVLELLEPDLFVTILDHEKRIQERQYKDPQWTLQKLSLKEVVLWQDREVRETEKWAKRFKKRHIVLGRNQAPETLYKILNYPDAPIFYSNFPMTWLEDVEKSNEKITENNEEMKKYGIVIDPRTIEIMKPGESDYSFNEVEKKMLKVVKKKVENKEKLDELDHLVIQHLKERKEDEEETISNATVNRDLEYYVKKVDVDILYLAEMVFTFGGIAEILTAHKCSKPTYLILPEEYRQKKTKVLSDIDKIIKDVLKQYPRRVGPFERYHSLKVFFGKEEFHEFLPKNFPVLDLYK